MHVSNNYKMTRRKVKAVSLKPLIQGTTSLGVQCGAIGQPSNTGELEMASGATFRASRRKAS